MGSSARPGQIITLATVVTLGSVLPVFLLGVNGPSMMAALGFGVSGIGLAAGSYTAGLAVASSLGFLLDRATLDRGLSLSLALVALGGSATASAGSLPALSLGMCLGGIGSSAIQMSTGRILAQLVTHAHGVAFGWFQSAKPAAVALAGGFGLLAVLGLHWRWAFMLVAGVTLGAGLVLARWCKRVAEPVSLHSKRSSTMRRPVLVLALFMGAGFALTGISATFLPDTVLAAGGHGGGASALLMVGGTLAAVGRVLAGRLTDHTGWDEAGLVAPAFVLAGIGSMLISTLSWGGIVTGCILVFAFGWAFGGLLIAKGTRLDQGNPGSVIGHLLLGGAVGGSVAPPLFGAAAEVWGYATAWLSWGVILLVLGFTCLWVMRRGYTSA